MAVEIDWGKLQTAVEQYADDLRQELNERWERWQIDLSRREMHEVLASLLARQVSLATQLALNPMIWNGHIAPLILRSMIDNYISMAWIWCDPVDRSRKFILYGLGQEKLHIEHLKTSLQADGINPDENELIKARESWINCQRYTFLTEVNLGSWSGIDTRKMADEAGCLDLYRHAYTPFSAATHNMWPHVARYNLLPCPNPLHKYHNVPFVPESTEIDPDYLYRAAKYAEKAFDLFDKRSGVAPPAIYALKQLAESMCEWGRDMGISDSESE